MKEIIPNNKGKKKHNITALCQRCNSCTAAWKINPRFPKTSWEFHVPIRLYYFSESVLVWSPGNRANDFSFEAPVGEEREF